MCFAIDEMTLSKNKFLAVEKGKKLGKFEGQAKGKPMRFQKF